MVCTKFYDMSLCVTNYVATPQKKRRGKTRRDEDKRDVASEKEDQRNKFKRRKRIHQRPIEDTIRLKNQDKVKNMNF